MPKMFDEEWAIVATIDPDAYGTGAQTSDVVDMASWEQIAVIVQAGTLGSSATLDCVVKGDTASGGSYTTTITNASITQLTQAGTDSNKQAIIVLTQEDMLAQGFRYARVTMTVGTASSDCGVLVLGKHAHYGPASGFDLSSVDEIVSL